MPELSVIVCTHDRPDELRRCLSALAELDDPAEVVVVDSASPTPCTPLVEAFRERLGRLVHIRLDEPGLSLARNAGISAASGEIIAFVDDDAAPAADWAAVLLRSFAADPAVGCVGGACIPDFAAERPRWMSDRLLTMSGITRFGSRAREPR